MSVSEVKTATFVCKFEIQHMVSENLERTKNVRVDFLSSTLLAKCASLQLVISMLGCSASKISTLTDVQSLLFMFSLNTMFSQSLNNWSERSCCDCNIGSQSIGHIGQCSLSDYRDFF